MGVLVKVIRMKFNVIVASPVWSLNGVNVFSTNLVRGLRNSGVPARILLTQQTCFDSKPMPRPSDIPLDELQVGKHHGWIARWKAMIRYLEERVPCIYIPNHDYGYSCVSATLSNRVGIVGIVHSDDPEHYDHVCRLGKYWNAIVAVSEAVSERTASLDPTLSQRLVVIPHGVCIPDRMPQRSLDLKTPLKIIYAGRLGQYQKRILDLPKILDMLLELNVPVQLTIVGGGSDQQRLIGSFKGLLERGIVRFLGILDNERVLDILGYHDVFIMTSEFEGLPISLLEAMGRGCVPVVTDIASGIPELVRDGINGYRVPVGSIRGFAERLAVLQRDLRRRWEMSVNAYTTVSAGRYRIEDMVESYINLFAYVLREAESGAYRRPTGTMLSRPFFQAYRKNGLPTPVRAISSVGKYLLRQIGSAGSLVFPRNTGD